ncbi:MAG: deoxyribonuclease IV [Phycisphaerales bacterium]|nr:deoxyribonuclease IV [Phycisphaerales bacterium]
MFGSHLSIAGSMVNALLEGERLGLDTVQVFTKNQRQWRTGPLDPAMVKEWHGHVARLGWSGRIVAHASYLINLGSPDGALWARSIDSMVLELQRSNELGIAALVHHPGAYTTGERGASLKKIAAAYTEVFRQVPAGAAAPCVCCLENTVGSGSNLGREPEELARLRAMIAEATGAGDRVGFCIDTCHLHAGGYDMASRDAAARTLDEVDRVCGLAHVKVVHLNDSKAAMGSRRDLHEHIGAGTIGRPRLGASGFAAVVNHPALRRIPKILETPKGTSPAGVPYDAENLARLKSLLRPGKMPISGAARPRQAARGPARPVRKTTSKP